MTSICKKFYIEHDAPSVVAEYILMYEGMYPELRFLQKHCEEKTQEVIYMPMSHDYAIILKYKLPEKIQTLYYMQYSS